MTLICFSLLKRIVALVAEHNVHNACNELNDCYRNRDDLRNDSDQRNQTDDSQNDCNRIAYNVKLVGGGAQSNRIVVTGI